MKNTIIAIVVLLLIGFGGYKYYKIGIPPKIIVINQTDNPVYNIDLTGRGFKVNLDTLRPKETFIFQPSITNSESGLEVSLTLNDKKYEQGDLAYIQNMSYGKNFLVTIQENGSIKSKRVTN